MDRLIEAWSGFGAYGWLALAATLIAFELMTGTAYLLWLSTAAALTAGLLALNSDLSFPMQLVAFAALSIATTAIGGRFVKPGWMASDQPDLNLPNQRHIGAKVAAAADFVSGEGRVRMGDTEWSAKTEDGTSPENGAALQVVRSDGGTLHVKAAE